MCLHAGPAAGFDPPERVRVAGAGDAIAWARANIPEFGWFPEIYVLFLGGDRTEQGERDDRADRGERRDGGEGERGEWTDGGDQNCRVLVRAVWLGAAVMLDDFVAWPGFSLGYLPPGGAAAAMLVVCRPGAGVEPTRADRRALGLLELAHEERGVPLVDVVLVDSRRWHSMTGHRPCGR